MRTSLVDSLICPLTGQDLALEVLVGDDDTVEYGLLASEAGTYPVVAGIPIFREGSAHLVSLLREGRHEDALVAAVSSTVPPSGAQRVAEVLASLRPTRALGSGLRGMLGRRLHAVRRNSMLPAGFDAFAALRHVLLESPARSPEGWNYFAFRFGLPRHFVGLAFIEAAPPGDGPVLDLGCGAGHLTWGLRARMPHRTVVACDIDLLLLLVARSYVSGVEFVCADATALPLRDRLFEYALSSDVFSFITRKATAARELERVLAPGAEVHVTSVINALQSHTFAGEPLTPDGWGRVFQHFQHHALPDSAVIVRYMAGEGLPSPDAVPAEELQSARVISLRGRHGAPVPFGSSDLSAPPHARGVLGVHPLFVPESSPTGVVRYVRRTPSEGFAADNADLRRYLPEAFTVRVEDVAAAREGRISDAIEALVGSGAVLGYPPDYPGPRWPGV